MKTLQKARGVHLLTAGDIMQRNVVTIQESATAGDLDDLLSAKRILGVPVVNKAGKLVGVASVTDLAHKAEDNLDIESAFYQDFYPEIDVWDDPPASMRKLRVRDIMTTPVITAHPDELLPKLAKRMRKRHIHRIVIAEGDEIRGLVTTMDILRVLE